MRVCLCASTVVAPLHWVRFLGTECVDNSVERRAPTLGDDPPVSLALGSFLIHRDGCAAANIDV